MAVNLLWKNELDLRHIVYDICNRITDTENWLLDIGIHFNLI